MTRHPRLFAAASLLAALCTPAFGQVDAAPATQWRCWYNGQQHVACLLRQAASAAPLSAAEGQQLARVPAFTRSGVLPEAVRWLRERPGAMRGRTILIPLHGEPIDHVHVGELAQAVMCGAATDCSARYDEHPATELADAADFADANDPLLGPGE